MRTIKLQGGKNNSKQNQEVPDTEVEWPPYQAFYFFQKNFENHAKISGNVFSYTIGGLKASEKENSVLCLYRIGEAAPQPEIRERAKVRENILHWP